MFHDDGATLSLCRHSWARDLRLPWHPVSIYIKMVNKNFEKMDTREYVWTTRDRYGKKHTLYLIGIEEITEELEQTFAEMSGY